MKKDLDTQTGAPSLHPSSPVSEQTGSRRSRRMRLTTVVGFVGALGLVVGPTLTARADVITPLPEKSTEREKRFSPAYDYDGNGCLATAAISPDGKTNIGLGIGGGIDEHCHDLRHLENSNTYSRDKCFGKEWCVLIYASYFEKDQKLKNPAGGENIANGHRHDIEHVIVWIKNNKVERVAVSCHGGWDVKNANLVRFDGEHPKVVYHKDGVETHCFRLANESDDAVENPTGKWYYPPIVGWDGYPNGLRDRLLNNDFGKASFELPDSKFDAAIRTTMPKGVPIK